MDYNIIYYVKWSHESIESLEILVNFLKKYKIIPSDAIVKADTFSKYFAIVNAINPDKFTIFSQEESHWNYRKKQKILIILWLFQQS